MRHPEDKHIPHLCSDKRVSDSAVSEGPPPREPERTVLATSDNFFEKPLPHTLSLRMLASSLLGMSPFALRQVIASLVIFI